MMHESRRHRVTTISENAGPASALELARKLTQYSWTPCTGFRLGSYLFLNDATSPDGAQEWAVFDAEQNADETHTQVESMTFSWMTPGEAFEYLLSLYGLPWPTAAAALHDAPASPVTVAKSIAALSVALSGLTPSDEPQPAAPKPYAKHHLLPHPDGACSWCA